MMTQDTFYRWLAMGNGFSIMLCLIIGSIFDTKSFSQDTAATLLLSVFVFGYVFGWIWVKYINPY